MTGEELYSNVVRDEHVSKEAEEEPKSSSFLEAVAGGILKGALEGLFRPEWAHIEELNRHFVATLRMHAEQRMVGFFQDKDIPELKEGIQLVQEEDWKGAIAKFQAAAETHPTSKALHKAYFNLGVAFEYNHDFEKALASLRLAEELAPKERFSEEIGYCQQFARFYRWQHRHTDSAPGESW